MMDLNYNNCMAVAKLIEGENKVFMWSGTKNCLRNIMYGNDSDISHARSAN